MLTADQLKNWVSKGKIKEALDALQATSDEDTRNEILQIIARYHEYNRQRRLGLSNSADLGVELAHIRQALLENIDRFVQQGTTVFLLPQNKQQENFAIEKPHQSLISKKVAILALIMMLALFIFLYCFNNHVSPGQVQKTLNPPDSTIEKPSAPIENKISSSNKNKDRRAGFSQSLQTHKFAVVVLDSLENKRIENATVRVGEQEITKYTLDGRAEFEINDTGTIKIQVEKEGFKRRVEWLSPTQDIKEIKIVKQ